MTNPEGEIIFIIDNDESVLKSLSLLLRSNGFNTSSYTRAADFFNNAEHDGPGCIICDVFLDDETGLELQQVFLNRFSQFPLIYFSGHADIPMSVGALKKGAINFLQKPVDEESLVKAVKEGLEMSKKIIPEKEALKRKNDLLKTLTQRELEVLLFVVKGFLNKQIAAEMNIAEQTVKIHRGNITSKLGLKSVADLVIFARNSGII